MLKEALVWKTAFPAALGGGFTVLGSNGFCLASCRICVLAHAMVLVITDDKITGVFLKLQESMCMHTLYFQCDNPEAHGSYLNFYLVL